MSNPLWPLAVAGLSVLLGLSVRSSVCAVAPKSIPASRRIQPGGQAADQDKKRAPTFEETRNFILKYTGKTWEDEAGDQHTYVVTITNRRLKYVHRCTSRFVPGYTEKIEVALSDLDPARVGKGETIPPYISLATTNNENRISIEVIPPDFVDHAVRQKTMGRSVSIPGTALEVVGAQEEWDARLKKAWTHLITLAGGKPSTKEPF